MTTAACSHGQQHWRWKGVPLGSPPSPGPRAKEKVCHLTPMLLSYSCLMLIVVRNPVIDLRSFAHDEAERDTLRLPPSWDVGEFVRGVGPIVRRRRKTGVAWPNERTFVDFSSTLRFNPQDLGRLGRSLHPIRVRRMTRRMWSQLTTEPALLNLDVALPLDGPSWAIESAGRWLPRAIQDLLDVETRVPSGSRSPLSRGLVDVLDRYGRETRMDNGRKSYLLRSGACSWPSRRSDRCRLPATRMIRTLLSTWVSPSLTSG